MQAGLHVSDSHAPQDLTREMAKEWQSVSEEERKAMMAWYFKKQEEETKLAEDDEDAFVGAKWAVRLRRALPPPPPLSPSFSHPQNTCAQFPPPTHQNEPAGPKGPEGRAAGHGECGLARGRRRWWWWRRRRRRKVERGGHTNRKNAV